jgi:hypothetical protein
VRQSRRQAAAGRCMMGDWCVGVWVGVAWAHGVWSTGLG